MAIDFETTPFLFSVGTYFSYVIDEYYYNNVHYVWCTTHFDDKSQPITSRPFKICERYFDQITSTDRHTVEIENNKAGILRGAHAKRDARVITPEQFDEICQMINLSKYADFFPILYVIDAKKVGKERCIEVNKEDRASDESVEYKIFDLSDGEYEIIDFKSLFSEYIHIENRKAGK